jgi:hypothetical protein
MPRSEDIDALGCSECPADHIDSRYVDWERWFADTIEPTIDDQDEDEDEDLIAGEEAHWGAG